MNQKIETQKIKVNNGQELVAKAQEYKNSGGEWKLLEKYWTSPGGPGGRNTNKKYAKWGIIISNGKQKIDIYSDKVKDWKNGGKGVIVNRLDEVDNREELHQLFPEARFAYFAGNDKEHDKYGGRSIQSQLDFNTYKSIKEEDGEYDLVRYLVAENSWHLKQILNQYCRDNETKIYQSSNPHFSGWVEIIDGQDGNMYLYVGEKRGWGRELKIGIKKEEFYSKKDHNFYAKNGGGHYSAEEMLELAWNLFTIGRPRTLEETHEYYSSTGGLEEEWQRNWPHRRGLCRKYLEELRGRMMEKFNYWQEKTRQKEYWNHEANEQCILAKAHIAEIDHELTDMKKNRPNYYVACEKDCTECGVKLCCHKEGQDCKKTQCGNEDFGCHFPNLALEENNNPTDSNILEKEELVRKYMEKHNIYQISLDNDQLVIKYNSKKTQKLAVEGQELQTIKNFVEKQTNKSIIREQSLNSNQPEKPNYPLWIGIGTVGVLIGAMITYFLVQKKRK